MGKQEIKVCDTKVLYDTLFEAEVTAVKFGFKHRVDMYAYICPDSLSLSYPHYHISHVNIEERKGAGLGFKRCPHCKQIIKAGINKDHFNGACIGNENDIYA